MHIENEKRVVQRMVELYCRHKLHCDYIPEEYLALINYAHQRLDRCKFGDKKMTCKKCPIHCYKPEMRDKIREVMRWVGPRMIFYDPIVAIRHLFNR